MEKLLSRNNDGVVEYRVLENEDGSRELIRIYPGEAFRDPVLYARFRERLHLLSTEKFPGVPKLSLESRNDGRMVVRRSFVNGEPLHRYLKDRRLDEKDALDLLLRIARVLAPLHGEGIPFGNLTPRHIVLTEDGQVNLVNIRLLETIPENLSFNEKQFAYLARYLAPECAMGETPGKAADLYALGLILFEMLHGSTPYQHDDPVMTAWGHVNQLPEIKNATPRTTRLLLQLLAKEPENRPAGIDALIAQLEGRLEPPETADVVSTDTAGRDYLSSLQDRYQPMLENWRSRPQQAVLTAMMGLIIILIPVIWVMRSGLSGVVFRIDPGLLFRESFRAEYLPQLQKLPTVSSVTTEGTEATVRLKLDKDRAFLETLQEIFASGVKPRCEFDLSGSREIRIRYTGREIERRMQFAMADLQEKLQTRLRREKLAQYDLSQESLDRLRLKLPGSINDEARHRLLARRSLSLHLLRNGTDESRLDETAETLLVNGVEERFTRLLLGDSKQLRQRAPRDEEIQGVFWNLLGQFNLQNPPPRVERMISPLPVMFEPLPEAATDFSLAQLVGSSRFLVVSPDPVGDAAVVSGSRIRFTVDKRFIFQLGNRFAGETRGLPPGSNLPLVLAEGNLARAILYNPAGLAPDDGLVLGFTAPKDLFDFAALFEAALPPWVVVE